MFLQFNHSYILTLGKIKKLKDFFVSYLELSVESNFNVSYEEASPFNNWLYPLGDKINKETEGLKLTSWTNMRPKLTRLVLITNEFIKQKFTDELISRVFIHPNK